MKLEQFKLYELKCFFKEFQNKYGLLSFFKIYTLNKFDLVTLLRNTKCFHEYHFNHIMFKMDRINIKLVPKPKKTIYRGEKIHQLTMFKKEITVVFD